MKDTGQYPIGIFLHHQEMPFSYLEWLFSQLHQCICIHLKALVFLYCFDESVDCHLLSSFCDDSNLHIMRHERRPTGLGYIFSPSAYSNTKRKEVKLEGNDYLQQTHHNWTKANELQRTCFKQDTKANQRWLKAM